MKVNSSAGFDQYKNYVKGLKGAENGGGKVKGEGKLSTAAATNTDKVVFSESATAQAELSRIAKAVTSDVESVGSDAQLAQLQQQVADGTYFVEADDLASSILGEA